MIFTISGERAFIIQLQTAGKIECLERKKKKRNTLLPYPLRVSENEVNSSETVLAVRYRIFGILFVSRHACIFGAFGGILSRDNRPSRAIADLKVTKERAQICTQQFLF